MSPGLGIFLLSSSTHTPSFLPSSRIPPTAYWLIFPFTPTRCMTTPGSRPQEVPLACLAVPWKRLTLPAGGFLSLVAKSDGMRLATSARNFLRAALSRGSSWVRIFPPPDACLGVHDED